MSAHKKAMDHGHGYISEAINTPVLLSNTFMLLLTNTLATAEADAWG